MTPNIATQFLLLFRQTKQRLQAIAESHSLTFPQLIALFRLHQNGKMTMSDLTAHLGVTRGALTGLVDRLEEGGLVSRHPDEQDRRVVHLVLTPRARTIMAAFDSDWNQEVQAWLAPLDEETRHSLSKGLTALLETETSHDPQ